MEKRSRDMATAAAAAADGVATPNKARAALRGAPASREEPTILQVILLAPDVLECHLCSTLLEAAIF